MCHKVQYTSWLETAHAYSLREAAEDSVAGRFDGKPVETGGFVATLTTISESPLSEGLLYTGSDDGLIHVSEDGGGTWTRAAALPGVPERAFINKVEADVHTPGALFALADLKCLGKTLNDRKHVCFHEGGVSIAVLLKNSVRV